MSNTLLVETTLLNTFLDDDSWTYVKAGDTFVRKKARDLNQGDLVVVQNEAIHKTLDEIIPVLQLSMRYRIAEEALHESNCTDQYIPKLRILLLEGLADPETPQLREKILKEGCDFTPQEYARFRRTLCDIVDVGEDAVDSWLRGETLAPFNWENFNRLIPIHLAFEEVYKSYQQKTGYYTQYQLYVGLRRTIMAYLAKRTGKAEKHDKKTPTAKPFGKRTGAYSNEIELVVGHFITEIDDTYSAARITKIRRVDEKKKNRNPVQRVAAQAQPHLAKAILCEEIAGLELRDMEQIKEHHYLLSNALYDVLNRYLINKVNNLSDSELTTDKFSSLHVFPALTPYLCTRLLGIAPMEKEMARNNLNNHVVVYDLHYNNKDVEEILERHYQEFLKELHEDTIDALLRLEPHTVSHIIDYVNEYRNALPRAFFESQVLKMRRTILSAHIEKEANRKARKEYQQQLREAEKQQEAIFRYLKQTYNIDLLDKKRFFYVFYKQEQGPQTAKQWEKDDNITDLQAKRLYYESQGYRFYRKHEVQRVLDDLGIPSAIRVYDPRTFI